MSLLNIHKPSKIRPGSLRRLYLSCSSEGYGHSSRILALARQFQPEEILIGTYSYALDRIKCFGYPGVEVSQELKFFGDAGAFDVGKTILKNRHAALQFNQIVSEEKKLMVASRATLVVADGRLAPVMAAAKLGLPCVVVTNQSAFYPFFAQDSALIKLFGRSFEWWMKTGLSSADEIWIPDFPPPDTVCLLSLSNHHQVKKRTRFTGPLVAWQADEITPVPRPSTGPYVVASLGGHSYRKPLFDTVLATARQHPEISFTLLTSFTASRVPDNVSLLPGVAEAAPYFKAADLVITQAGHSTAMELLTLGIPALVIPDAKQAEQENNAKRLVELGMGCVLRYDTLEKDTLSETLNQMLNTPSYHQTAQTFAQQAATLSGAQQAAQVLRHFADRLLVY